MPETSININKKLSIVLLLCGLGVLLLFNYSSVLFADWGGGNNGDDDPCHGVLRVENITVHVNYRNGSSEDKVNLALENGTFTVFAIMEKEFVISYDVYSNGYFITSINGATNGWTYKVDTIPVGIASNKQCLSNNTVIEWNQL
ncbi:MAG: DUF4430 domain-containing protein [Promethearchaeota archaeon]